MPRITYKILFFTLLISLLASCSDAPKRPDQKPDTTEEQKIVDPAEQRINQAKKNLSLALAEKQPKKNQLLFAIIDFLFQPIDELGLPSEKEYQLISEILNNLDANAFINNQYNHFLLSKIKLLIAQQEYNRAEVLLDEFNDNKSVIGATIPPQQLIEYHQLRATVYEQAKQKIAATKELIQAFQLTKLHQLGNTEKYLLQIWNLINTFPIYQLENQLQIQSQILDQQNIQFQLSGWLQLMRQVKKNSQQYQLNKQLVLWSESFPLHMANQEFIQQRLVQRFELLSSPTQIALLLPNKTRLSKVSQVITNGFIAAHFHSAINNQLILRVYDSSAYPSIWPSYKKALADGAQIIVGPFEKKHIIELSQSDGLPVTTLALNNIMLGDKVLQKTEQQQLPDKNLATDSANELGHEQEPITQFPENLYQFALNPEDEVAILTQAAKQQGLSHAVIISPQTKWGKRIENLYKKQWLKQGGIIISTQDYSPKNYDYSNAIKHLLKLDQSNQRRVKVRQVIGSDFEFTPRIRQDIDVIFLAAFPKQAKQIPLQISYHHGANIPIYASSHIIGKAFIKKENTELNGVSYTDMPWLLDSKIPAISRSSKQKSAAYQRLFAFGVDSYNMLPYLKLMAQNSSEQFTGETGLLHITKMGYIKREIPIATIKNGSPIIKLGINKSVSKTPNSSF